MGYCISASKLGTRNGKQTDETKSSIAVAMAKAISATVASSHQDHQRTEEKSDSEGNKKAFPPPPSPRPTILHPFPTPKACVWSPRSHQQQKKGEKKQKKDQKSAKVKEKDPKKNVVGQDDLCGIGHQEVSHVILHRSRPEAAEKDIEENQSKSRTVPKNYCCMN